MYMLCIMRIFLCSGPDFKTLVTPLVKHVRIHMIDTEDIMKVGYCSVCTYIVLYMYSTLYVSEISTDDTGDVLLSTLY